jgi:hypothetical protein
MSRAKNQVVIYKSKNWADGAYNCEWKTTKPNTSKMCTWFVTSRVMGEYYTVHVEQVIPFLLNELNNREVIPCLTQCY